jgi:hypothetical protein
MGDNLNPPLSRQEGCALGYLFEQFAQSGCNKADHLRWGGGTWDTTPDEIVVNVISCAFGSPQFDISIFPFHFSHKGAMHDL